MDSNIVSIVLSLCAISLTAYGAYATRRHNRLSVTPHLSSCTGNDLTDNGLLFSFEISNNGIGSAKIKDLVLFQHGEIFPKGKTAYIEDLIKKHLGTSMEYQIVHQYNFGTSVSIRAGDTRCLVKVFFPGVNRDSQARVLNSLEGLDICIKYESFYGEKFTFDTRDERILMQKTKIQIA